jgi:hypothetical protein
LSKSDLHVSYELDAAFEQFFRKKLRVPPLVDPRAVEIYIFADLTISKRQKLKIRNDNITQVPDS